VSAEIASDAAIHASASTGVDDMSIRWTSGASARASVTQHGAVPCAGDLEPDDRLAFAAWSGQIGAADSLFTDAGAPIAVHAIGVPRTAPITQ